MGLAAQRNESWQAAIRLAVISELSTHPATRWCLTLTDRHGRAVGHACSRAGPGPPGTSPAAWLARLKITWLDTGTCAHQLETPGYRPGARLRHLVTIRHPACTRPGCTPPRSAMRPGSPDPLRSGRQNLQLQRAPRVPS